MRISTLVRYQVVICLGMICFLMFFSFSCKRQSGKEAFVGLWGSTALVVNERDISDGKEWFMFQADGKVESRTAPSYYEKGQWYVDESRKILYLISTENDSLGYDYEIDGENLKLKAFIRGRHAIELFLHRIDKKPITMLEEMGVSPPVEGELVQ